jgi:hypothetical protein
MSPCSRILRRNLPSQLLLRVPLLGTSHSNTICSCLWARSAPAAQHLPTPPTPARHRAHARATRSVPLIFLPPQHLHRLSSTRAPASPKPCRSRSRARLTPVLAHACSRVARAHSEPQSHAYTGPVLLLHLCAPRYTSPARLRSRAAAGHRGAVARRPNRSRSAAPPALLFHPCAAGSVPAPSAPALTSVLCYFTRASAARVCSCFRPACAPVRSRA